MSRKDTSQKYYLKNREIILRKLRAKRLSRTQEQIDKAKEYHKNYYLKYKNNRKIYESEEKVEIKRGEYILSFS